jgi:FHA domain
MAKLILRFGNSVLKEATIGERGVKIGRSPDNDLVIDNQAVSHHHARVFIGTSGHLLLEDRGSLNGTMVNGQLVRNLTLKPGDSVAIGKHTILVEDSVELRGFLVWRGAAKPDAPKINETIMLGTKERVEFLQKVAAQGEKSQVSPSRLKVPTLMVKKGKTNQREYMLTDKLTVIGRSSMATVKLRGWFAPKVAAQINRRGNNAYYIGAVGKIPRVNGHFTALPTQLSPGDLIEVAGVRLEFSYRN